MVNMVCSVMGLQLTEKDRLQMVKDLGFWRNLLAGLKNLFCFDKYSSARAIHHFQKVANRQDVLPVVYGMRSWTSLSKILLEECLTMMNFAIFKCRECPCIRRLLCFNWKSVAEILREAWKRTLILFDNFLGLGVGLVLPPEV